MSGAQPPPYQELQPPSWTSSLPRPEPSQERYEDWLAYTSLRPSFLLAHGVATIVGIVLAAVQWYIVGYEREGPEALAIASATLFTVFFVFEACGFVAGCMSHTKLIWGFARFSILSYVLVVVAEVIALVNTYANKDKIKRHCVEDQTQNWNSSSNIYEHEAPPQDYCDSRWGTTAAWDVVWLILLVIFGAFFYAFTMRFQLRLQQDTRPHRAHEPVERQDGYPMQRFSTMHSDDMDAHDDAFGDIKSEIGSLAYSEPDTLARPAQAAGQPLSPRIV
ncbi:uncharacterized protein MRET_3235 [Malassezia restricta]|uniref:uncharacterized protein n=1 Tax=Malassezia restricta TaxID=76775 RepID=UPI000DD15720|nr:uncharacterized protein MRET_3235 [Malassezia restricta]AXA50979.1 uncharacterized protein MRET_3235 [Malassezia restricta]